MKLKTMVISVAVSLMLTGCASDSSSTSSKSVAVTQSDYLQEGMSPSMVKGILGVDGRNLNGDIDNNMFVVGGQEYEIEEYDLSDDSEIVCVFKPDVINHVTTLVKWYVGDVTKDEIVSDFN